MDSNGSILKSLPWILAIVQKNVFEIDLNYPKELRELQNDYPLVADEIEIWREMLSDYWLKISDLYYISIANVKKLEHIFFDKICLSLWKIAALLETRIKTKKSILRIRIKFITMAENKKNREKWKQRWKSVVQTNK